MAEDLLKQGLAKFLTPEEKFAKEKKAGRLIFGIAIAVEVLAASIGLFIAWIMAYSAYYDLPTESQNTGAFINALIGALPFLVIAVIEPTKIPLAYGLYKVRLLGWKLLIFIALVCLTIVTFETMFTSLERQLTNVTIKVVRTQNNLNTIEGRIAETERLKLEVENKTPDKINERFAGLLNDLYEKKNQELEVLRDQFNERIEPLRRKIDEYTETNKVFLKGNKETNDLQLNVLLSRKDNLSKEIENIRLDRDKAIQDYKDDINDQKNVILNGNTNRDDNISLKIKKEETDIKRLRESLSIEDEKLQKSILKINDRLIKVKLQLNDQRSQELSNVPTGLFSGDTAAKKAINEKYNDQLDVEDQNAETQKQQITKNSEKILNDINEEIKIKRNKINDLNEKSLSKIDSNISLPKIDNRIINNIKNDFNTKENKKQKAIDDIDNQISKIVDKSSGKADQARATVQAKIDKANDRIIRAEKQFDIDQKAKNKTYEDRIQKNEIQKDKELASVAKAQATKEKIEDQLKQLKNDQQDALELIRNEAQKNQIYRFAASWNNLDDVALVTKEQLKWISILWFGSIAFIVSTMGTVLAIISVILQDPDAFINKPRLNLKRLFGKILLVAAWRLNKLIASLVKLLLAISKLLLSFAEIFRGFIGKPLQRSIRKFLLSFRKRMNKPKIVIEKVEVEKEVEVEVIKEVVKEVEVIKEVEVEVEKEVVKEVEVIKEVPVDKIVIKEVPKEIIRKELVYVPLYSVESGTIDATNSTKNISPDIDKKNKNSTKKGKT